MPRTKVDIRTASRQSYEEWRSRNPQYEDIPYKVYESVINNCNSQIVKYVAETGNVIKLPWGISSLYVRRKRPYVHMDYENNKFKTQYKVDFQLSKNYFNTKYNLNHHTQGWTFKFIWDKRVSRVKFAKLWRFRASRYANRDILKTYLFSKNANIEQYRER